jgi:tetratricopeptide (TPR) repeat protein
VEASKNPEMGYQSAYLLDEGLAPGAGHLVHMPSHIYIRTGDYHKGSMANLRAIKVDSLYVASCNAQGVYPLIYMPHNYHFLAACASLAGNSERAVEAAEEMSREISLVLMEQPGWKTLQHYYIIPYYVYVKFGKWDKILSMNVLDPELTYPQAIRHYARGMAYLGKGKTRQAKWELAKLKKISNEEAETLKEVTIWQINTTYDLVQIAIRVLEGEILAAEGNYDKSISLLKEAVAIEDGLNYQEPPDWFFSVRHHLGAVQIEAGKYEQALATYREDLETYPKNGWALHGIKLAYEKMGKTGRASNVDKKLREIWAYADVDLKSSRILATSKIK